MRLWCSASWVNGSRIFSLEAVISRTSPGGRPSPESPERKRASLADHGRMARAASAFGVSPSEKRTLDLITDHPMIPRDHPVDMGYTCASPTEPACRHQRSSPMLDIHMVMAELAKTRPIFHSEADFQHALAWQIHEMMRDIQIRLEFNLNPLGQEGVYLDIWLPCHELAVELKYKTKPLLALHNSEAFLLKEQGAQNHGRYDFLKDVERVESAERGVAIILTNEPSYWKEDSVRDSSNYYDFRIHEGRRLSGELKWKNPEDKAAKTGGRQDPITLSGSYNLRWEDYSRIPRIPGIHKIGLASRNQATYRQFRYLVVAGGESHCIVPTQ